MPNIPEDVNTIVMRCLEKDPQRRYESARALAEDLHRYLDGEAILARRASLPYRAAKKIRKHRWLVAGAACVITILLAALFVIIHTKLQSSRQLRAANQFGREVEKIEAYVRQSHQLPLHDIRYMHKTVESQMEQIRNQMQTLGSVTAGPGHYALGRG